jgi:hypothetical protein
MRKLLLLVVLLAVLVPAQAQAKPKHVYPTKCWLDGPHIFRRSSTSRWLDGDTKILCYIGLGGEPSKIKVWTSEWVTFSTGWQKQDYEEHYCYAPRAKSCGAYTFLYGWDGCHLYQEHGGGYWTLGGTTHIITGEKSQTISVCF